MLKISNVSYSYSTQEEPNTPPALSQLSLNIEAGETIAVIGHNGSGKSTLARLIAGMLLPQQGTILVDGHQASRGGDDLWSIRQRVGFLFQNPDDQLIANTVTDDIAFGPENLGLAVGEIEQRVQEALTLLGLEKYAQTPLSKLSLSLKQRVAIAGVLAMQPSYLLLDEPTTMISGRTAQQLLETVKRLARERGMAVLHITHFMHEISHFGRVLVMHEGKLVMDGTPAEIFGRPEELQQIGLAVPLVTQLSTHLRQQGWSWLPQTVISPEELVQNLHPQADPKAPILTAQTRQQGVGIEQAKNTNHNLEIQPGGSESTNSQKPPLFELQGVSYSYQRGTPFELEALHDLSLTVSSGQLTALIGPSGAGKSSVIDLLAGLITPKQGELLFEGKKIGEAKDKKDKKDKNEILRSRVGVVFQSPEAQIFEETVGKDVSFGPRRLKLPLAESRRRVRESLEAVGLPYEDFRLRYTYALSGGQKRRVAIAGVLALQPDILLFDEPMAGLDPRGRQALLALLIELKQQGHSLIYASTSLEEVIECADFVHILDRGRLVLSGTTQDILEQADRLQALDIGLPEITQLALALQPALPELRLSLTNLEELEELLQRLRVKSA